jgi:hypothetical protein
MLETPTGSVLRKKRDVFMAAFFLLMGIPFLAAVVLALAGYNLSSFGILIGGLIVIWCVLRWRYPTILRLRDFQFYFYPLEERAHH